MRSIVIGLGLAASLVVAGDAGAQRGTGDVYGQRTAGSGRVSQREYALDQYLDGITLTALQRLRVQSAWNSGRSLERRLEDVRALLTSTQQRRFDRNVQALSQQGSYGTYGSDTRDRGTYDSRSREDDRYGRGDDRRDDDRRVARRDDDRRDDDRRDDDRRDAQRGKSSSAPHGKTKGHEKNGKADSQRDSRRG